MKYISIKEESYLAKRVRGTEVDCRVDYGKGKGEGKLDGCIHAYEKTEVDLQFLSNIIIDINDSDMNERINTLVICERNLLD